jgi:tripartite-type tricarboxylate transporter receptor subunit TctC
VKLRRRQFLHLAAGASALATVSHVARAETYPIRPVHLIVGFPPGGFVDITARLIGPWLSERLGQQFVVENRPGASSHVGARLALRAMPDGYTLLVASNANAYDATVYNNLDFNFPRDMAPIAPVMRVPFVMTVNPSIPAKTIPEFIAYAKASPGTIKMATAGPGSAAALFGALFKVMAGVDLVAVHYRGVTAALPDLISGRVDVIFIPVAPLISHIRSGVLRPLGLTTNIHLDLLPDVPPIYEAIPGYEGIGWAGIGGAANTPSKIIAILNEHVNAALVDPSFKARLHDIGAEPFACSPAEFKDFIAGETEKWSKIIRALGIRAEQ